MSLSHLEFEIRRRGDVEVCVGDAAAPQELRHQLCLDLGVLNEDPVEVWDQEEGVAEAGQLGLLHGSPVRRGDGVDQRLGQVVHVEVVAVTLEASKKMIFLKTTGKK